MGVKGAWEMGVTGRGAVVTILDDGIEKNHPDLARNYVSAIVYKNILIYCKLVAVVSYMHMETYNIM